jgi:hypothetical protein
MLQKCRQVRDIVEGAGRVFHARPGAVKAAAECRLRPQGRDDTPLQGSAHDDVFETGDRQSGRGADVDIDLETPIERRHRLWDAPRGLNHDGKTVQCDGSALR